MISTEELSELLETLYAAPLEPEKWRTFFDRVCALSDFASGYMLSGAPQETGLGVAGGGHNFDPETLRLYNEHYGANDPFRDPAMARPRVGIIQGEELVSQAELVRSEIYNELLTRYELESMTLMSCTSSTEEIALLPFWRSPKQGPIEASALHLLQTLVPHVQTALRLRTKLNASSASELFSETALEAISVAAFLVTPRGYIRHMNQLAEGYLQRRDGLHSLRGTLTAHSSSEDARMKFLISGATAKEITSKGGADTLPGGAMRVSRGSSQSALQITVIPAPERLRAGKSVPHALVFVSDPASLPRSRAVFMRQLYGLSPTEARLADLLLQGFEVREAANRLPSTLETARFHLKRVLAKTGTRRQAELMRLMVSLPGV